MEMRIFAHSWLSDWNHGNAHFLRGLARALVRRGHRLRLYEPLAGPWGDWSLSHLMQCEPLRAMSAIQQFRAAYPELDVRFFVPPSAMRTAIPAHANGWHAAAAHLAEGGNGTAINSLRSGAALQRTGTATMALDTAALDAALNAMDPGIQDNLSGEDTAREWLETVPLSWNFGPDSVDFGADDPVMVLCRRLEEEVRGADVVIVHEWNPPELTEALLQLRRRHRFLLLLHDTHHRAASQPAELARLPLHQLDGVLVFGESLRRLYDRQFGLKRLYVFHEAADVEQFRPDDSAPKRWDMVWIGNWGDGERTQEIEEYLLRPAARLKPRPMLVHGVRYPAEAVRQLRAAGICYGGYLPNLQAPSVYAAARLTLHIPRSPYRDGLGGIPTIRVFEALACGCPLLTSPWRDEEGLFKAGSDFLVASNGREMTALLLDLLHSEHWRQQLAERGRATILERHTCAHRAQQLEEICHALA